MFNPQQYLKEIALKVVCMHMNKKVVFIILFSLVLFSGFLINRFVIFIKNTGANQVTNTKILYGTESMNSEVDKEIWKRYLETDSYGFNIDKESITILNS